jgi:Amidohydrolase family
MRRPLTAGLFFFLASCACGEEAPPAVPQAPAPPPAQPVATATPPAPVTVRRVVVSLTRPSGSSVTTTTPDGTVTVAFDVQENGRGPHTDATIHLAPDGTLASFEGHGHHEMGTPVDETFTLQNGHATWKSHEESGDRQVPSAAFFIPIADTPDVIGMLASALLKAGGTLPLLPSGEAHVEKGDDITVTAGGTSKHLTSYLVTGLELTPTPEWMEDDGTWFGYVSPWFSVVPEGWESAIDPIIEKERAMQRARDKKNADRLAHKPPSGSLALTHARVLDVEHGRWLPDQTIVIAGDTIKSVGPSLPGLKLPDGVEVIDVAGKAVLPGLWDMHSHLSQPDGALDIASGVTTARDVGNDPDQLDDFKKRFDEGSAIGPHVLRAGFIEGRGEKAASSKITAETEAEAVAGVEFYAKRGYEMIKIYNSVRPDLVPIIAREAHARGMMVTGHIPVHMLANEAVKAGYDGIEHVNMLFLNFFADHDTDTRTPLRFSIMGDRAATFDFNAKPVQDFFALLRDKHTVVDPTVDAFEDLLVGQQGKVTPGLEWLVDRLPVQTQRSFLLGGLPMNGKEEIYRKSFDKVLEMVKRVHDAKIREVVGTDSLAGLMVDHEMELFVRAGISPAEVLQMATIEPARAMKLDKKSGSIAAGKAADLAVVDGDPLARITDVRNVVTTIRGGVVFQSKDVFETVGVKPGSHG